MAEDTADDLTFAEMMEFTEERVEEETEDFNGDLPNHAAELLVSTANDLLQTVTNIRVVEANEDMDDPTDEDIEEALAEDATDLLLALGSLRKEYDLDVESAFAERMEFAENYAAFEEATEDAESQAEVMEAFEEHMGEEPEEFLERMGGNVEAGMNVDDDDYDPEGIDRGVM